MTGLTVGELPPIFCAWIKRTGVDKPGAERKLAIACRGWTMVAGTILSSTPEDSGNRATAAMRSRACSHDSMRKFLGMFQVKFAPLEQMWLRQRW
jgi:hypothetical protein